MGNLLLQLILCAFLVGQNVSSVLIGRYVRAGVSDEESFVVIHALMYQELFKFILSSVLELIVTRGQLIKSLNDHVFRNPMDSLLLSIPALLYLIQNVLLFVALTNISAPLVQVTYQGKLITTALLSVVLLNRRYKLRQWICLFTLFLGVALCTLGAAKTSEDSPTLEESLENNEDLVLYSEEGTYDKLFLGMVAVIISCFTSALAGVFFEKVLKRPTEEGGIAPPSVWMRNMQLSFFSFIIAYGNFLFQNYQNRRGDVDSKPFMFGFTSWVWILIVIQALGGLLVAAVIKYADNVVKGLATGIALVVASIGSIIIFHTVLTKEFVIGATIILVSVAFFATRCPCEGKPTQVDGNKFESIPSKENTEVKDTHDANELEMIPMIEKTDPETESKLGEKEEISEDHFIITEEEIQKSVNAKEAEPLMIV